VIQDYQKLYTSSPLTYNLSFEKSQLISTKQQNHEFLKDNPLVYNYHKGNLQVENYAASNVEAYIHETPRLAVSRRLASGFQTQYAGAAETSNNPHNDGRYHLHEKHRDIRMAVPGKPGFDYSV
jgi:hypothetical protein